MTRAPRQNIVRSPRALLAVAALACLLCSDGVGPRLIPYPTDPEGPRRVEPARERRPEADAGRGPARQRALMAQAVKLNSMKQEGDAGPDAAGLGAAPGAVARRATAPSFITRPAATPNPFHHTSTAPHRGPPSLS